VGKVEEKKSRSYCVRRERDTETRRDGVMKDYGGKGMYSRLEKVHDKKSVGCWQENRVRLES
jgi:hypothetical protein